METRTTKEVIDEAIKQYQNLRGILIVLSGLFTFLGICYLTWGGYTNNALLTVGGMISMTLVVPTLFYLRRISLDNIAIRILEANLSRAENPTVTADFLETIIGKVEATKRREVRSPSWLPVWSYLVHMMAGAALLFGFVSFSTIMGITRDWLDFEVGSLTTLILANTELLVLITGILLFSIFLFNISYTLVKTLWDRSKEVKS